jgi:hypothetical protein
MAIIRFASRPADADVGVALKGVHLKAGVMTWLDGHFVEAEGPSAYWTWETHKGLCLADREMNGYDDSDFYMTVWNAETGAPEEILFASTRGWSYPSYASYVDATPEVRAAYEAYLDKAAAERKALHRKAAAAKLRKLRTDVRERIGTGDRYVRALKLRRRIGDRDFGRLVTFLGRNLRSKFKLSLKGQALAWFDDAAPKYARPLSPRQWEAVS